MGKYILRHKTIGMENEIKKLIEKWNHEFQECEIPSISPRVMLDFAEDLKSLLELYQSKCEVSPKKEMPTIHDTIYEIGGK